MGIVLTGGVYLTMLSPSDHRAVSVSDFGHVLFFMLFFGWPIGVLATLALYSSIARVLRRRGRTMTSSIVILGATLAAALGFPTASIVFWSSANSLMVLAAISASAGLIAGIVFWPIVKESERMGYPPS